MLNQQEGVEYMGSGKKADPELVFGLVCGIVSLIVGIPASKFTGLSWMWFAIFMAATVAGSFYYKSRSADKD